MGEVLLEVDGLTVDFPTEDGVVHAVRGVSFTVSTGEVVGIVGESGCGKSVTNLAIMGLLPRTARVGGSATFRGQQLLNRLPSELVGIRGRKIAMIFQDPMTALNPVYRVGWQLAEGIRYHQKISKKAAWARAVEMLRLVGIPNPEDRANAYPHEFSGGMRQRAMIAMAMANEPEILVADEPSTALDVTVQAQILETLVRIKEETGTAIILITHDLGVVAGMVDRLLVMYAGRVVEDAPVDDIFDHPRMPYTAGLLGAIPSFQSARQRLNQISGAPPSLINPPPGCPFSPRCPLRADRCNAAEPELVETDRPGHRAACYRVGDLAAMPDPREIFLPKAAS
jgi:peptide/nickel transport system ATP-binding protein